MPGLSVAGKRSRWTCITKVLSAVESAILSGRTIKHPFAEADEDRKSGLAEFATHQAVTKSRQWGMLVYFTR
jgi:hypothetical protein